MREDKQAYIGDGVYTSFDGYQIWLHVGAHTNPPVVALEPAVLIELIKYAHELGFKLPALNDKAIHHIDGDPTNNASENLRIVDMRDNRSARD